MEGIEVVIKDGRTQSVTQDESVQDQLDRKKSLIPDHLDALEKQKLKSQFDLLDSFKTKR